MGMKGKLTAGCLTIAAVLLVSCMISVMEFMKVDNFATDLASKAVRDFSRIRRLSQDAFDYNQELLTVIGVDSLVTLPPFDMENFQARCDTLARSLNTHGTVVITDSLKQSFLRFYKAAEGLPDVLESDFINTRSWYFSELQPKYKTVQDNIDLLNAETFRMLDDVSRNFDRDFFRSIIPGIVAVGVAILMVLLLMFYLIIYYARPLDKILSGMKAYTAMNKKYNYRFEGDDQLYELNEGITGLAEDNWILRKRISDLRNAAKENGK